MLTHSNRYEGVDDLYWQTFGFYAAAKITEILDKPIYKLLCEQVSGHTLKHLFAAVATQRFVAVIQHRQSID